MGVSLLDWLKNPLGPLQLNPIPSKEDQMTVEWAPFDYLDYWDYPRILVVTFDNTPYLLDAPFDEEADDYVRDYAIKVLNDAPGLGSWADLGRGLPSIGSLTIGPELFDKTRRREIRVDFIRAALVADQLARTAELVVG